MPRAKTKPETAPAITTPNVNGPIGEVLTLAEAAAYLRLPEEEVERLVHQQDLPGRYTGNEWRFSKSAIQAWLSQPLPKPSKEAVLSRIGSWKGDPDLDEIVKDAFRRRGRPTTEESE
jgi:excisionase family DNA binding protein